AVLEVDLERHQGEPLLAYLRVEAADLLALGQELAVAPRLVVELIRPRVLRDVGVEQPQLAAAHLGERVHQRSGALPQRLHLAAEEHDAGLEGVLDRVVVPRLAVAHERLSLLGLHGVTERPYLSARASASTVTDAAPAARRARAATAAVAPVVTTSSTRTRRRPGTRRAA